MNCKVSEGMFEGEGVKKYMKLELDRNTINFIKMNHVKKSLEVKKLVDPLDGNVLRVKIPFRYNRVMCKVSGSKTIQELVPGDRVQVKLTYCGWWESGDFGGPSWKLDSICYQESTDTGSGTQAV